MTAARRYRRHDPEAPDDRELVEALRPAPTVQFYGGGVGYGRADLREAVERLAALLDEALGALNALRADCPVQTPAVGWHRLAAIGARRTLAQWRAALDGEHAARARPDLEVAAQLASKLRATAAAHETNGPKNGRRARADGLRWAARIVEREALPGGGE